MSSSWSPSSGYRIRPTTGLLLLCGCLTVCHVATGMGASPWRVVGKTVGASWVNGTSHEALLV
jgi:hypothetical protein